MSWTAVDHEGTKMWEQDGERVKEVPEERSDRDVEYSIVYCKGIDPIWVLAALAFGVSVGMILAKVFGL